MEIIIECLTQTTYVCTCFEGGKLVTVVTIVRIILVIPTLVILLEYTYIELYVYAMTQ